MSTKTAVYLRQSLDRDGNALAVARQRAECLRLCEQRGWSDVAEYVDNDRSATNGKPRPEYQRMLADIRDGRIGAVVVWDLDRLHRQPRELEDFIDLADQHRLQLATVTGDCDLSTDNGRLFARIKGAVGKSETERKAARQRAAARQKAERGKPQWRKAFGYLDGPNGPEPDPATALLVKQAYADVLTGGSLSDIARGWNADGVVGLKGQPWTPTTVSLFLRAPRNAGLRAYNGEIVGQGTWTALVDESTWRATQAVLNAPGRSPGPKTVRAHLLTGLLVCGKCGGRLSGIWVMRPTGGKPGRPRKGETKQPSSTTRHIITYACQACHGVSVREDHVKPLIYRVVSGRLAMSDATDLLKAELHDTAEAEALRIETETLLAQIKQAERDYDDDLISAERMNAKIARVNEKLRAVDRRSQDQERLRVFDGLPLGTPEVAEAVEDLSRDRFRAVLSVLCVVTVVPVGKGGNAFDEERVRFDWR